MEMDMWRGLSDSFPSLVAAAAARWKLEPRQKKPCEGIGKFQHTNSPRRDRGWARFGRPTCEYTTRAGFLSNPYKNSRVACFYEFWSTRATERKPITGGYFSRRFTDLLELLLSHWVIFMVVVTITFYLHKLSSYWLGSAIKMKRLRLMGRQRWVWDLWNNAIHTESHGLENSIHLHVWLVICRHPS
jgi:hypothetical protein